MYITNMNNVNMYIIITYNMNILIFVIINLLSVL